MKKLLLFIVILQMNFFCTPSNITGTSTGTSSGSIAGIVRTTTYGYTDSVKVIFTKEGPAPLASSLSKSVVREMTTLALNGRFFMDSLDTGAYRIDLFKYGIKIGSLNRINIKSGQNDTVCMLIDVLVKYSFSVHSDSVQTPIILNGVVPNGVFQSHGDSTYTIIYLAKDTLSVQLSIGAPTAPVSIDVVVNSSPAGYSIIPIDTTIDLRFRNICASPDVQMPGSSNVNVFGTVSDSIGQEP